MKLSRPIYVKKRVAEPDELACPGVYVIELKIGNSPGRIYVGSSQNVRKRILSHLWRFRAGDNLRVLQKAFDEYGEPKFNFYLLYKCPESELPYWEKYWIDRLQPEFNKNNSTDVDRFSWRLQKDEYSDCWDDPIDSIRVPEPDLTVDYVKHLARPYVNPYQNPYDDYSPEEVYQGTYVLD